MSIKAAFDRLNTWSVTGVTTNYGLDDLPGVVAEVQLPALVVLPAAREEATNIKPLNLSASKAQTVLEVDHILLVCGIAQNRPQERFYNSLALVDNYLAKVVTDWTLNDQLLEPLQITGVRWTPSAIGQGIYYSVVFRHKWVFSL